jgi:protein-tyrosine phosphatase
MSIIGIAPGERLPVEGTYNLRELGGLRAGGNAVRWGKLYRSDALGGLTPLGRQTLADLGIGLVVDLRTADETVAAPTLLTGPTIVHSPIFDAERPAVRPGQSHTLDAVYDSMLDHHGSRLADAVRHIAHSGDTAVLVHCTAGKDRTGLVVALALLAAGVGRDDVVLEYAQTEQHLAGEWAERMLTKMTAAGYPVDDDILALIGASPAALLERIVDRWHGEWGSPLGFLVAHGFTTEDHEALRASLLD